MADPGDIVVVGREDGMNQVGGDSSRRAGNSFKRWNSSDIPSDVRAGSPSRQNRGNPKVDGSGGLMGQTTEEKKEGPISQQEHLRAQFYKHYQKEAEEFDREFMKKYDEDLNTTLIFAGLFSAVASAFIIVVHSEFQPNLNEETNALLRVMIHTMDNTAFGGQVPTVPQWTGPPRTVVQVQAILLASLSISLLSAFLAMLGKQWLNRCTPINMRGTIIERSQYRQRKLDGIANWYFDHVMESLPLMLQAALLLLGCALSRYLWEINTTVASVVLGVTSFGVLFYLFIVIAGAASANCPYQTPGADFLRHIPDTLGRIPHMFYHIQDIIHSIRNVLRRIPHIFRHIPHIFRRIRDTLRRVLDIFHHPPHIFGILRSVFSASINESFFFNTLLSTGPELKETHRSLRAIAAKLFHILLIHVLLLPLWLIADACRVIFWLLAGSAHWVRQAWLEPQTGQQTEQQTAVHVLDLRCILWTLQTSVDGPVRLSALEYLAAVTLDDFDPTQIVAGWFDILIDCVNVTNGNAMIVQGLEELAATSSLFCLRMLSNLMVMDPMPKGFEDIRRRYTRAFPFKPNFDGLPFSHTLGVIHSVFCPKHMEGLGNPFRTEGPLARRPDRWRVQWNDYKPSNDAYITVAHVLTKLAQLEYQRSGRVKVPRWFLRFALHSLSQDPLPPASVIVDSLSIIAIELECDVPNAVTIKPLGQNAQVEQILGLITGKLVILADARDQDTLRRKRKAITALFPYAVWQERDKQHAILDVFLHATKTSQSDEFLWHRVKPFVNTLFNGASDVSLKRAVMLVSPYVPWDKWNFGDNLIRAWVAIASTIPKDKEVAPSVVDALLQIASLGLLPSYNYGDVWSWLTLRPSLPSICKGRRIGSDSDVVRAVRELKDIDIFKSYLLLVWSEWDSPWSEWGSPRSEWGPPRSPGFLMMCEWIREELSGIEMNHHRAVLVQRLDHVLGQLDKGLEYPRHDRPELDEEGLQERKDQYERLREVLLEADRGTLGS